jgi:hypothetical protein
LRICKYVLLGTPALDTDYLILLSLVLHWKLIMNINSTKIIEKIIENLFYLKTKMCENFTLNCLQPLWEPLYAPEPTQLLTEE